jgi:eukaryotic-like serine/threonine-protein kinase
MTFPEPFASVLADRYRLEKVLGEGGMATVYLAEDLKHKRRVAIKVLRPELGEVLGADRFLREIQTTANLRHPHILPLYDSGEAGGLLFYVMPLVDGESLRDRLQRERQLPMDEALSIAREVGDALGYAHGQGVVHRDIKPENILLEAGHAVVADFGIARAVSKAGGDRLTQTGLALGTPLYMSPEQASGDRDVDGRSDLYSLGCVLYEMLAGQTPFTGPTAHSITRQHMVAEAPPVTNLRPAVPNEIAGILARILAKDPVDRFSPAASFVQAITTSQRPAASRPASSAGISTAAGKQRRGLIIGAVTVAILATGTYLERSLRTAGPQSFERIAVLPLDNGTGDTTQLFFADGMTRELIGVLSDVGVRVLGHRAVAPYRASTKSTAEIARTLGVDALVTGTVLRVGSDVQVAVELTDPRTSESLWARTFSRAATDVVTLQREIAGEIARGISARLTPDQVQRLVASRPVEPRAYTQYLLGQEQANLRTPDGFSRSFGHFTRSIAIDSTFAPAWAALAMSSAYALIYQTAPRDSSRALLERAAARAMALDPQLGDPYFALATLRAHIDWDFAESDRLFREGQRRTHSTPAAALFGWVAWELGRWQDGVSTSLMLIAQEPTTSQWRSDMAWSHWSSRDTAQARAAAESAIAADSTFYEAHDVLSLIELDARNFDAADRAHARATALAGGDYWVRQLNTGMIASARGDTATVRRMLRELDGDPRLAQRAALLYLTGDKDAMYAMFDRAIIDRDPDILMISNGMPILFPVRKEPRYQRLLERIGLPVELR